jgi:hypothetical protein
MLDYITPSQVNWIMAAELEESERHHGRDIMAMPTHAEIARRAYDIYLRNGCTQGQCEANWHQAEYELLTAAHRQRAIGESSAHL